MLACTRIGAIHSVVFGGFSPESLRDRINDAQAKSSSPPTAAIAAARSFRSSATPTRRSRSARRSSTWSSCSAAPGATGDEVVRRDEGGARPLVAPPHARRRVRSASRRRWTPKTCSSSSTRPARRANRRASSTPPAAISSASTTTTKLVFDLKDDDVFWCTADVGWVTGHSYLVYGPLANGATCVMYEGAPDWPEKDRFWEICERHGVTILYTAPTAIRAFMKWGDQWPAKHDLSRLRLLGSVGEPINPEAWMWYREKIGGNRCPIVDTWWQTETGAIVISPLPGVTETKPGSATTPLPGFTAALLDAKANEIKVGGGLLALTKPVAVDAAHDLGRRRALRADVLLEVAGPSRPLLPGRRRQARRRRLLLDPRPRRRRAQRRRPPHRHDGSRIGARRASRRGRGRGGRQDARAQGPGARRVRDVARRVQAQSASCAKSCASSSPRRSARSPSPTTFSSPRICRRRDRARSCGGCLRDIAEGRALGDTTTLADPNVVASLKDQYEAQES